MHLCKTLLQRVMLRVPVSELFPSDGAVYYIPHHGVYHQKKTGKIRVVFDCSAKFKGTSLNDNLLQGPNLTNTLIGVLCRFRQESIAFIGDIEAMFYQFRVNPDQRDFLRFLWWEDGDVSSEPKEYRMNVHLYTWCCFVTRVRQLWPQTNSIRLCK